MQHIETRQLRKHYAANRKRNREGRAKKFAQMRAAKERKRIERANTEPQMPDLSHCVPPPKLKPSGFEVTVRCLDDGARASFRALRLPWGLSISPTLAGRKVACVLREYLPTALLTPAAGLCLRGEGGRRQGETKTPTGGGVRSLQPSTL